MKTIAFVTDIHLDEGLFEELGVDSRKQWQLILKDIAARGITEIIFGGDIGASSTYPWFFQSVKDYNFRFILGNHDTFENATAYVDIDNAGLGALYYTADEAAYKFIFLDTSTEKISANQLQWLKHELLTDKNIILFIHHPVLNIDTPIDRKYPLEGRDVIADVLRSVPNQITIFCGHYHMADTQTKWNITQIVTPASSYQIIKQANAIEKDNSTFGYRLITLGADSIETELLMYRLGMFTRVRYTS
jgi:3',5'-cyclic AMP phosphodiesterase CpdA